MVSTTSGETSFNFDLILSAGLEPAGVTDLVECLTEEGWVVDCDEVEVGIVHCDGAGGPLPAGDVTGCLVNVGVMVAPGTAGSEQTADLVDLSHEISPYLTEGCSFDIGGGPPPPADIDGDGDVDWIDLWIVLELRQRPAEMCPNCDLDGDGWITVLDARKVVLSCTRPRCAAVDEPS